ncbi:hypothetical protein GGI05_006516 [Coemansia sp. RSA 2603]|nr:hypothetical protein GGI05_006516 [Coemansia sp. RSA 2603]
MCDIACSNRHRFGAEVAGMFRLYDYACNICGKVFSDVYEANDHVKENHFFPPLDY